MVYLSGREGRYEMRVGKGGDGNEAIQLPERHAGVAQRKLKCVSAGRPAVNDRP
jgi:hypothetical protein